LVPKWLIARTSPPNTGVLILTGFEFVHALWKKMLRPLVVQFGVVIADWMARQMQAVPWLTKFVEGFACRFIPTFVHGLLDYPMSLVLIALPWIGGIADGRAAQWVPIAAGVLMLILSAMTDYELGLVRAIPMTAHLAMDVVMGLFLAVSPWLFGFASLVWIPFVVLGLLEAGAAAVTQTRPAGRLANMP
jgi:hypothetical protein